MLLLDVDGIMPLKICFILRLNTLWDSHRTGPRPLSYRDVTLRTASTVISQGYTRHGREESSFIIMTSCEPTYLRQDDSNIVFPTDSRGMDTLHISVKAHELLGTIGLYVDQLLDREDLTRKLLGNCA